LDISKLGCTQYIINKAALSSAQTHPVTLHLADHKEGMDDGYNTRGANL